MGTGGKERPGRDADHSPHLVPRTRMSRSYISSPAWHLRGVAGQFYFTLHNTSELCTRHISLLYPLMYHHSNNTYAVQFKLRRSSLHNFLLFPIAPSFICPNILLSVSFSKTFVQFLFFRQRNKPAFTPF
jgi:hypothetical protein